MRFSCQRVHGRVEFWCMVHGAYVCMKCMVQGMYGAWCMGCVAVVECMGCVAAWNAWLCVTWCMKHVSAWNVRCMRGGHQENKGARMFIPKCLSMLVALLFLGGCSMRVLAAV